ncbi:glycosyltransferase family 1 protein [Psychrobacillus sp. INOP01]|uniref:glycosyltransferase family 1 protein n=1 Tax=Psychrobacillus sp. INOP01 TaxID=2829187 RepID=UPI001BACBC88|nr:glycosyltransferase family 1 protein [Psychrobacillus sp. INOP01]QUG40592.1 glycosyltransferase family 1 protein [Psychrobacillus sp. INOP01]
MTEPIRVLQVFAQMNRGGAETMIMNLYRNIDRSKIQFDFIVHTEEKCAFDDEIYKLGGKIFRVPAYKGKNHMNYVKSWRNFFEQQPEYNIIHGHVRSTAAIYLKIAKKYKLVTIAHSHSISSGTGLSAKVKDVIQYPIRNIADYLLACSKPAGEWLFGEIACKRNNFYILNNAIDTKKFVYSEKIRNGKRNEFPIKNKLVLGHVGRFNASKNHDFLIDIFKAVCDRNENAVLMLVGDGELRKTIEKKVNDLDLGEKVIFTGVREDIDELIQAMDMFVFPSLYEGLGIVLIEAQVSGLPCVVSDKIPKEAIITSNVEQVRLNNSPKIWSEVILTRLEGYERISPIVEIKNHGYDIEDSQRWLQKFYLGLVKKDETRICI